MRKLSESEPPLQTEEVFDRLRSKRVIPWQRVDRETVRQLVLGVAEELRKPLLDLETEDFRVPLQMFGGNKLTRLYAYNHRDHKRQGKDTIAHIFERTGIRPTVNEVVAHIRAGHSMYWDRIPSEEINKLLEMAAVESKQPVSLQGRQTFRLPLLFLNNHTLQGLYHYAKSHPERQDILIGQLPLTAADVIQINQDGLKTGTGNFLSIRGQ